MLEDQKQGHRCPNPEEQVAIFGHAHSPTQTPLSRANKLGRTNRWSAIKLINSNFQKLRLMYATRT